MLMVERWMVMPEENHVVRSYYPTRYWISDSVCVVWFLFSDDKWSIIQKKGLLNPLINSRAQMKRTMRTLEPTAYEVGFPLQSCLCLLSSDFDS